MSAYIQSTLLPGEHIIAKAKLHWAMFIAPAVLFALGFAADRGLALLMVGYAIIWAVMRLLTYFTTELVLSNQRIITKFGIISRKVNDIQLTKVEGVSYKQGIIARLLGYGSIQVRGTGIGIVPVAYIAQPESFKQSVQRLLQKP